jgi:hypothetical protein
MTENSLHMTYITDSLMQTKGEESRNGLAKGYSTIVLTPILTQLTVKYIHSSVYTAHSMSMVMDLHNGFNLCGLDNIRLVEAANLGDERLLRSSSYVKRVFTKIEKEMSE